MIYNYFADNIGTVASGAESHDLEIKYKDWPVRKLRSALKKLRNDSSARLDEIKYVSHALRRCLRNSSTTKCNEGNDTMDYQLKKNFWKTCKIIFNSVISPLPSFNFTVATNYFMSILEQCCSLQTFKTPSWIPAVPGVIKPFNNDPPLKVVNKLRSSSSPCPLDQMPVLVLKKRPIVRTALHLLVTECWRQGNIPYCWKRALRILIFMKGVTSDPANFQPITLQPVFYKVLSALYRDRLYRFLVDNNYLNTDIQKGF